MKRSPRAYWKIVWTARAPEHGDECRTPLPTATARLLAARRKADLTSAPRVCTRLASDAEEARVIHAGIPGSRVICMGPEL